MAVQRVRAREIPVYTLMGDQMVQTCGLCPAFPTLPAIFPPFYLRTFLGFCVIIKRSGQMMMTSID